MVANGLKVVISGIFLSSQVTALDWVQQQKKGKKKIKFEKKKIFLSLSLSISLWIFTFFWSFILSKVKKFPKRMAIYCAFPCHAVWLHLGTNWQPEFCLFCASRKGERKKLLPAIADTKRVSRSIWNFWWWSQKLSEVVLEFWLLWTDFERSVGTKHRNNYHLGRGELRRIMQIFIEPKLSVENWIWLDGDKLLFG